MADNSTTGDMCKMLLVFASGKPMNGLVLTQQARSDQFTGAAEFPVTV